jgi:hypothetical protein
MPAVSEVPDNTIGLTDYRSWDGAKGASGPMSRELDRRNVAHTVHQLPQIVGPGGNAYLVCYALPHTSLYVTVLAIPHRYGGDQVAEDYYYFEGMTEIEALDGDHELRWAEIYDQCTKLMR